ncbi:TPA: NADH oxidoreductase (quinone) subunit F [Candidatus Poribacteria bacterium]|nr:NADH oxidoreductase (quinone) subunit F [Candidatus Poribacteria bacterium]
MEKTLLKNFDVPHSGNIDVYIAHGGYQAVNKALINFKPKQIIELIKNSGLRGRGGAGFPTGLKWELMPDDPDVTKYLVVNTDEGEPGTFKDRYLVEKDPHQVLEGVIITAYAVGAHRAFVYIRGEFFSGAKNWIKVIADAYERGFLGENILGTKFNLDVSVHRGAGAYICGEETALLESLEGKRGIPRLKPPYPSKVGLWAQPTLVHNVETLACVPHIILKGSEWFANIGTKESKGPKIFCVSGHVEKPGNYELPMGTTLREIIYEHAGGIKNGRKIKAIIPGGASTPMLTSEHLDVPMAFESLPKVGSMLGTGAVIVMDDNTCIVNAVTHLAKFFAHESCGKCAPCRIGTRTMMKLLGKIEAGKGRDEDIDLLLDLANSLRGTTFCPLGEASTNPVISSIKYFRDEYEYHIKKKQCMTTEVPISDKPESVAKILVVDDDPDFVEITRFILESNNYKVIGASNGSEGIAKAKEEEPDLIISDIMMSSVLDGLDMSWKMQEDEKLKHIPIIMVTSIANTDYASLFPTDQYIHVDEFLFKPVPPDKLLDAVKRMLSSKVSV